MLIYGAATPQQNGWAFPNNTNNTRTLGYRLEAMGQDSTPLRLCFCHPRLGHLQALAGSVHVPRLHEAWQCFTVSHRF